jgi:heme/copper-type cytochrome/quinol oxidase subunit 4
VEALKFLLIAAFGLSLVCLLLALYHFLRMRQDAKRAPQEVVTQRPLWLEFPRAYTHQGRRHQRRFFTYFVVFVVLFITLFVIQEVGIGAS